MPWLTCIAHSAPCQITSRNIPEVFRRLRLGLRAGGGPKAGGWEREISLETAFCTHVLHDGQTKLEGFDRCVADAIVRKEPLYDYPDISVNFGPTNQTDYELFLYNTPRYISLAGLLARAQAAEAPGTLPQGPRVYKILNPLIPRGTLGAVQAAQRLVWQAEHHTAVGFAGVVM